MKERRPEVLFDPQATPDSMFADDHVIDPQEAVEKSFARRTLYRALRGMPAEQREIIILRDIEEMSYEEIAEVLGCSRPSVKLRLFRARRRLKERVESLMAVRS